MVHDNVAGVIVADVFRAENGKELAVCVERDGAGCPVEAVFVEFGRWIVGEAGRLVVRRASSVVALGVGFWRLEDKVDGAVVGRELAREKLNVDFLTVVAVLWATR